MVRRRGGRALAACPAAWRCKSTAIDEGQPRPGRAPVSWGPRSEPAMFKRILVPTDGSALSRKAIRSAVDLAAAVGAEVFGLNVVPCYPTAFFEGGNNVPLRHVATMEKQWAEQGRAVA